MNLIPPCGQDLLLARPDLKFSRFGVDIGGALYIARLFLAAAADDRMSFMNAFRTRSALSRCHGCCDLMTAKPVQIDHFQTGIGLAFIGELEGLFNLAPLRASITAPSGVARKLFIVKFKSAPCKGQSHAASRQHQKTGEK